MRKLKLGSLVFLLIMGSGCGSDDPDATSQAKPRSADSPTPSESVDVGTRNDEMVSPAAVSACGGFTLEDAAAILGVPASELEDRSDTSSEKLTLCSFLRKGSAEGIGFYLSVSDTVERAVVEMEQGRGMAEIAQTTIDQVTGTESQEAAQVSVNGVGEDAYFMEVNGTFNARVGNVQIQVFHLEDRESMKEVGRRVAGGLRKP